MENTPKNVQSILSKIKNKDKQVLLIEKFFKKHKGLTDSQFDVVKQAYTSQL
jgi:predicted DNA binding protein